MSQQVRHLPLAGHALVGPQMQSCTCVPLPLWCPCFDPGGVWETGSCSKYLHMLAQSTMAVAPRTRGQIHGRRHCQAIHFLFVLGRCLKHGWCMPPMHRRCCSMRCCSVRCPGRRHRQSGQSTCMSRHMHAAPNWPPNCFRFVARPVSDPSQTYRPADQGREDLPSPMDMGIQRNLQGLRCCAGCWRRSRWWTPPAC